jgi:L-lactate dehydrogenase complex protein LldG
LSARDEILARIRAVDRGPALPIPRNYRRTGSTAVDLFCDRVADYRADVRRTHDAGAEIARLGPRLAVAPGVPAEWRPAGCVEDDGLTAQELDALDGALTGCTAGIAETGTLVLRASPLEGRRVLTLVPDLHVCVVRAAQVVETVPEAFALLAGDPRPVTFVSGPSATSDIELSRVEGVHGPRELVVIVLEEQ